MPIKKYPDAAVNLVNRMVFNPYLKLRDLKDLDLAKSALAYAIEFGAGSCIVKILRNKIGALQRQTISGPDPKPEYTTES